MRIIFLFIVISHSLLMAQDSTAVKFNLTIKIAGFESDDGSAMVALVNSQKSWQSEGASFKNAIPKIEKKRVILVFNELPKGTYGVKVYHDENDNRKLDSNFIGIPKEAYGFSNNARGNFGPADWQDAKFEVTEDKEIIIKVE